jgi:hypothetical protein
MPQNDDDNTPAGELVEQTSLALNADSPFAKALARAGVNVKDVTVAYVPDYVTVDLEDLCSVPSTRKGCNGESPLMVVTSLALFPEADDFEGYVGYFRCEAITEDREHIAITHYMFNKETGERSPLFEWVETQTPPFALKVAHMATRRGFSVYRPLPVVTQ